MGTLMDTDETEVDLELSEISPRGDRLRFRDLAI